MLFFKNYNSPSLFVGSNRLDPSNSQVTMYSNFFALPFIIRIKSCNTKVLIITIALFSHDHFPPQSQWVFLKLQRYKLLINYISVAKQQLNSLHQAVIKTIDGLFARIQKRSQVLRPVQCLYSCRESYYIIYCIRNL